MSSFLSPLSFADTRTGGKSNRPVQRRSSSQRAIRFADEKQRRTSAGILRRSSRLKILEQTLVFDHDLDVDEHGEENDNGDDRSLGSEDSLDQAALAFLGFSHDGDGEEEEDDAFDDDASFDSFVFAHGGNCHHRGSIMEDDLSPTKTAAIDFKALNTSRSGGFHFDLHKLNEKEMIGAMLQENMAAIHENEATQKELQAELQSLQERATAEAEAKAKAQQDGKALKGAAQDVFYEFQQKRASIMGDPVENAKRIEQEIRDIQKSSLVSGHLTGILRRTLAVLILQKTVRGFLVRTHFQTVRYKIRKLEQKLRDTQTAKQRELKAIANDPEWIGMQQEWNDWIAYKQEMEEREANKPPSTKDSLLALIEHELKTKERHQHNIDVLHASNDECQVTLDYVQTELENVQKRHLKLEQEYNALSEQIDQLEDQWDQLDTLVAAVQDGRRAERRKVQRTKRAFAKVVHIIKHSDSTDPYVKRLKRRALILEKLKEHYRIQKIVGAAKPKPRSTTPPLVPPLLPPTTTTIQEEEEEEEDPVEKGDDGAKPSTMSNGELKPVMNA